MSKSTLTPIEITLARKVMRNVNGNYQIKEVAEEMNEKYSTTAYRMDKMFPQWLPTFIKLIELGGYELVEKE